MQDEKVIDVCRRICIALTFVAVISASMMIIWLGIYDPKKFNGENAQETDCIITDHYMIDKTCWVGNTPPIPTACVNCDITLTHYINDTIYSANVTIQSFSFRGCTNIDKYPMGDVIACWYNVNNPYDIHKGELSKTIYYVATVAMILVIAICLAWVVIITEF